MECNVRRKNAAWNTACSYHFSWEVIKRKTSLICCLLPVGIKKTAVIVRRWQEKWGWNRKWRARQNCFIGLNYFNLRLIPLGTVRWVGLYPTKVQIVETRTNQSKAIYTDISYSASLVLQVWSQMSTWLERIVSFIILICQRCAAYQYDVIFEWQPLVSDSASCLTTC